MSFKATNRKQMRLPIGEYNDNFMASGINIYSQLLISTIRIVDINNYE